MNVGLQRRLNGVLGGLLLLVVGALVALLGAELPGAPVATAQVALLALAGVLDVVAAIDTPITDRVEWWRLSGLAHVLLGAALPLGFLDAAGSEPALLALTALGGLSVAAIGLDMLAFEGRHVYRHSLAETASV
jgi:hypothetical protein